MTPSMPSTKWRPRPLTLRAEFDKLFGFAPDQLMRQIVDAADDLADSFDDVDGSVIDMNGSIDISTDAGRRLQSRFEDMTNAGRDLELALRRQRDIGC